jgi:membrane-bound lytic murein transglycosylase D
MRMKDQSFLFVLLLSMLLAAAVLGLTSCASARPDPVRMSFLPDVPYPASPPKLLAEPPQVEPSAYPQQITALLNQPIHLLPHPEPQLALLSRAEMLFEGGKLHYEAGEMAAARRDFNRAIDTLLSAPDGLPGRQSLDEKLAELVEAIYSYDVSALGAGELSEEPVYERSPLEDIPELTFPVDPKQRNKVVEELRATVSQLPLDVNDQVLRYINYFSTGRGRRVLAKGLERMGRYRPLIQRILDEEGVPQELIHLAQAESAFSPRAVSRKRATGMWQFMLSRGREYGLSRTRSVDERLDPEKATRAAARHLRDLYTEFGDWYLAMAAYNSGPRTVERAIERTGYADFWELSNRNVLPKETANYVPIILAMTILAKNPADYGLDSVESDSPLEYSTVELESPTHLALVADLTECALSEIRDLNPALLRLIAPAHYLLRVPKGTMATVVSALEMIPPSERDTWRVHRVGEGETLSVIARLYRVSAKRISEVNHLDREGPETGNFLLIPKGYSSSRSVRSVKSKSSATPRKTTSKKSSSKTKAVSKSSVRRAGIVASNNTSSRRVPAEKR